MEMDEAAAALVDLERYPLTDPASDRYRRLIADCRTQLEENSLLALPGFLNPQGVSALMAEVIGLEPFAHRAVGERNPYGIAVSDDMPPDHPARILHPTDRYGVAYHDMGGTEMDRLYRWPPVRRFVADVLGLSEAYLHEDPSNALVLQMYKPGGGLAWHFDRATFSTILQLQKAEDGGYFEAAPGIRDDENENYDAVRAIMLGEQEPAIRRRSEPGTFVIIFGRNCMHRVTEVKGSKARVSLILSYEDAPGRKLDPETRKLYFGPTAPGD